MLMTLASGIVVGRYRLATHAALNGTSWVAQAVFSLVLAAIVFRSVSATEYGIWAVIMAFRAILMLVESGLALGVSRDAALEEADGRHGSRIAAARRLYVLLGLAAIGVGLTGSGIPGRLLGVTGEVENLARLVTAMFALETGVTLWASPYAARLRGHERFDVVAAASLLQAFVGLTFGIALVGTLGLVGGAIAVLAARLGWLIALAIMSHRLLPASPATALKQSGIGEIALSAAPLWVVAAAGQLSSGTDVPIVGAIYGSAAAGRYAAGAMLPIAGAGLLYVLIGAALPRLTVDVGKRADLGLRIVRVSSFLAALGFAALALNAKSILTAWLGDAPSDAVAVLVIYSLARAISIPTHVVILLTIAAGRYAVLPAIAVAEAAGSIGLGLLLALATPLGPALGTLVAVAVSNLLVTALILLPRVGLSIRAMTRASLPAYALGFMVALPGAAISRFAPELPLGGVLLTGALVSTGALLIGTLAVMRTWHRG